MERRVLYAALAGVLSALVPAGAAAVEDDPFPGYSAVCGYPVRFVPTPFVAQAVLDVRGREIILLDPSLDTEEERPRMQFLVAHECAHHRMRHALPHSRRARALSTAVVRDQEMSADCFAAELLARLGLERPLHVMAQRFHRGGLYSPGGGYPAGIQRAAIIQQCAEEGRRNRLRTADAAP